MIKDYIIDEKKEQELVHRIRKTTKRWKIGNMIAALFAVVGIILSVIEIHSGVRGAELVASLVAVLLFPLLGALLSSAVARTGGRDILLNRINERVYVDENELVESYTPRFRQLDSSDLVENHILHSDITCITHRPRLCQYVIQGRVTTVKHSAGSRQEVKTTDSAAIVLYEYFTEMQALVESLKRHSGCIIKEEE